MNWVLGLGSALYSVSPSRANNRCLARWPASSAGLPAGDRDWIESAACSAGSARPAGIARACGRNWLRSRRRRPHPSQRLCRLRRPGSRRWNSPSPVPLPSPHRLAWTPRSRNRQSTGPNAWRQPRRRAPLSKALPRKPRWRRRHSRNRSSQPLLRMFPRKRSDHGRSRASRLRPAGTQKIAAAIKRWFTEGNVPVKIGVLVLFVGVAAALRFAVVQGYFTMPIEVRLALIAAGALVGLAWAGASASGVQRSASACRVARWACC